MKCHWTSASGAVSRTTPDLVDRFLNVVLAKVALAAGSDREHGVGREGLADGDQCHFALQAPRGSRSLGNALVDPVQIGLQGYLATWT